jgi:hypothetical protein
MCISCPLSYLEGKSDSEIDLDKIFHRRIERMLTAADPVIAGLAKDSDMGSKPILEPAADVPEKAVVRYVRRRMIESLIYLRKWCVNCVISRAGEDTTKTAECVRRQVNTWPEVIQGESQDEVSGEHSRRRTA